MPIVCRFLALSRRAVGREFLLLGTNGARSGADVARMALAGASACELLSVVMHEGFGGLTRVIAELDALLEARGLSFTSLVGHAADALQGYGDQSERPGRWQDFVPAETLSSDTDEPTAAASLPPSDVPYYGRSGPLRERGR